MSIHWLWKTLALGCNLLFASRFVVDEEERTSAHVRQESGPRSGKIGQKTWSYNVHAIWLCPSNHCLIPEAAEKFLKTYDQVFASRPHHEGSWYIAHELRNSTFGQYGTFWRNMRKLCILRLLSNYKIKLFLPMRIGEIGILVKSLKQAAFHGAAVNHSAAISSLGANMNCLMIFGKMCMDKDFNDRGLERSLKKHCMLQQWLTSVITFPSFVCLIFRDLHVG